MDAWMRGAAMRKGEQGFSIATYANGMGQLLDSWDAWFGEAAEFASAIGPERLLNTSYSCDENEGVVTVWYWSEESKDAP